MVSIVSRRLSPLLTLDEPTRERHHVGRQPLGRRLEATAGCGSSPRRTGCTTVLPRSAGTFGFGRWLTSTMWSVRSSRPCDAVGAELGDRAQVLHRGPPRSPRRRASTRTSSSRLVGRFLPTKSGRIGSSRWPRSTSTASCTALRPAVVGERVERGPHRAPGEQHVVDEHDGGAVERRPGCSLRPAGHDRAQPDVVAVERDVDRSDGHRRARCARSRRRAPRRARRRRAGGRRSTTPSRPRLRSTISWAMRVIARRTSSAPGPAWDPTHAVWRQRRRQRSATFHSSVRASRDPLHGRRRG